MSVVADFIRSTRLIGQSQTLDKDQQREFSVADDHTTGCGDDEESPAVNGEPPLPCDAHNHCLSAGAYINVHPISANFRSQT